VAPLNLQEFKGLSKKASGFAREAEAISWSIAIKAPREPNSLGGDQSVIDSGGLPAAMRAISTSI
jgi:hypothetical protein